MTGNEPAASISSTIFQITMPLVPSFSNTLLLCPFADTTKAGSKREGNEKAVKQSKKARKEVGQEEGATPSDGNADVVVGSGRQAAQVME